MANKVARRRNKQSTVSGNIVGKQSRVYLTQRDGTRVHQCVKCGSFIPNVNADDNLRCHCGNATKPVIIERENVGRMVVYVKGGDDTSDKSGADYRKGFMRLCHGRKINCVEIQRGTGFSAWEIWQQLSGIEGATSVYNFIRQISQGEIDCCLAGGGHRKRAGSNFTPHYTINSSVPSGEKWNREDGSVRIGAQGAGEKKKFSLSPEKRAMIKAIDKDDKRKIASRNRFRRLWRIATGFENGKQRSTLEERMILLSIFQAGLLDDMVDKDPLEGQEEKRDGEQLALAMERIRNFTPGNGEVHKVTLGSCGQIISIQDAKQPTLPLQDAWAQPCDKGKIVGIMTLG